MRDSSPAGLTTVFTGAAFTEAVAFPGATIGFFTAVAFLAAVAFFAPVLFAPVFFAPAAFFAVVFFTGASVSPVASAAPLARVVGFSFNGGLFVAFAVSLPPSEPCSPTAESRRTPTPAAP
ncbi:hypothetical protein GCM10010415_70510 [Streptomyces atrovirens]